MDSTPGNGIHDGGGLSEQDRRVLATLEDVLDAGRIRKFKSASALLRLRLLDMWEPRLLVLDGIAIGLVGLVIMLIAMSTSVRFAIAGEGLLSMGTLLLATGITMWWNRSAPI